MERTQLKKIFELASIEAQIQELEEKRKQLRKELSLEITPPPPPPGFNTPIMSPIKTLSSSPWNSLYDILPYDECICGDMKPQEHLCCPDCQLTFDRAFEETFNSNLDPTAPAFIPKK